MEINDTIRKYSDNPVALERIMKGVKIETTWLRSESTEKFPMYHDVWKIKVKRGGRQITFEFHNSNMNLGSRTCMRFCAQFGVSRMFLLILRSFVVGMDTTRIL